MATLADLLRSGYTPPTESPMVDPIKQHIKSLPQKLQTNTAEQMALLGQSFPGNTYESMMTQGDPKAMAELAMQVPFNALTAFHGTPHNIQGAFSAAKGGTGQGSQNYGHGTYFAESPDIAEGYMQTKIPMRNLSKANGKSFNSIEELFKAIQEPNKGNLYKVDIPDEMIPKMLNWYEDVPEDMRKKVSEKAMEQFGSGISPTTGERLYKEIAFSLKQAGSKNPQADASKWLAEQGIPGIKYENLQIKKGKGAGTHNYVVFEPESVKILEKNPSRKELIEKQIKDIKE